ncbi:hypothetical protein OROMI_012693 [Orobanche minor]
MPQPGNTLKNGAQATSWSGDEFERVPLKQRLKLLLANYRISDLDLTLNSHITSVPPCATDLQLGCSAEGQMTETVGKEERHAGEPQMSVESVDDLEHVVLKERLRRLLASKCLELTPTMLTENSAGSVRGEKQFGDRRHVVSGNQICEIDRILTSDSLGIQRNDTLCSSKKLKVSAVSSTADIKIEPPGYDEFQGINVASMGQMSFGDFLLAKTEIKTTDDAYEDELDHMLLLDRMRLLSSRDVTMDIHQSSKCMNKTVPSAFGCRPVASTPAQSFKVNRPRKRRKTVTDSVETAMEEDAPGLLKVLIDKGVSADEIKLYGEPESDDALEDSSTVDNFAELEEVITKLFSQRESLLKLGPLRYTKGEKASYSLECLLSLVEQARYLRFRNWPVEWGWCRDLQSFIFVFERHNRIVLERPEYGYATYFFELPDSLPINWQIKRLITAMKLASCSRITIIENKALMFIVGDDLTEGEARVLMEYGWRPNTGLGTMLNYYDRVVHDKWNEKDRCDWRLKIAKLLTDGYNGGTVISAGIPTKVMELEHPVDIKLELN